MKKFLVMMLAVLMIGAQAEAISCADATFAFETINQRLREWNCTPLKIWYAGDDSNSAENIAYMNELAQGKGFTKKFSACMVFYSDFHSPPDDGKISAWKPDSDYKNWSWYFGRDEDGNWHLMTWGY